MCIKLCCTEPEESHHVNRKRSVPLKVEAKKDTQVQVLAEEEFTEGNSYKPISTVKCTRWALSNIEA